MRKFTLLELIIVIAVIAILLSLLLPSLSRAREKSEVVVCSSNQSTYYKGHTLVMQIEMEQKFYTSSNFRRKIEKMLGSEEIKKDLVLKSPLKCPTRVKLGKDDDTYARNGTINDQIEFIHDVTTPSTTLLFSEKLMFNNQGIEYKIYRDSIAHGVDNYHYKNSVNVTFFDGSIGLYNQSQVQSDSFAPYYLNN